MNKMVDVDKAIVARLKMKGLNYEVLVDCDMALDYKAGRIKNIDDVLATEDIFDDVKKGSHASFLKETFGTDDKRKIAERIIKEEPERKGFFAAIKEKIITTKINAQQFESLFWELELALMENNVAVEVIEKIKRDLKEQLVEKPIRRTKVEDTIQDSLKKQSKKIAEINAEINAWEEEKKLLTKNNSIAGQTNGVSAAELIKMADLFRTRLREINTQMLKLEEARMVVSESFSKTTKQLDEQNAKENQASFHIMISVNAEAPVNANIEFKYLIEDAGWDPYYDIRALDVSTPISFDYKAKIYNNCGLDWNDVKLTLSTADPSLSAQKPKLDPWNLNYKSTDVKEYTTGNLEKIKSDVDYKISIYGIIICLLLIMFEFFYIKIRGEI